MRPGCGSIPETESGPALWCAGPSGKWKHGAPWSKIKIFKIATVVEMNSCSRDSMAWKAWHIYYWPFTEGLLTLDYMIAKVLPRSQHSIDKCYEVKVRGLVREYKRKHTVEISLRQWVSQDVVFNLSPGGFVRIKAYQEWEKGIPSKSFTNFIKCCFPKEIQWAKRRGKSKHINTINIYCYDLGSMMKLFMSWISGVMTFCALKYLIQFRNLCVNSILCF